jgi:hypothetical protein
MQVIVGVQSVRRRQAGKGRLAVRAGQEGMAGQRLMQAGREGGAGTADQVRRQCRAEQAGMQCRAFRQAVQTRQGRAGCQAGQINHVAKQAVQSRQEGRQDR